MPSQKIPARFPRFCYISTDTASLQGILVATSQSSNMAAAGQSRAAPAFPKDLSSLSAFPAPIRARLEAWIHRFATQDNARCSEAAREVISAVRDAQAQGYDNCPQMVDALELILVSLVGHHDDGIRDTGVIYLNVLYDGHLLQESEPLPVTVADAGKPALVSIPQNMTTRSTSSLNLDSRAPDQTKLILRMYGPDPKKKGASSWKEYPLSDTKSSLIECQLPEFPLPGFYDWIIAERGTTTPVKKLRGRFIVHPQKVRKSVIMEVPIDEVGASWESDTGKLDQRGTFASVQRLLSDVKMGGVTSIYFMGALARPSDDVDSSPFAVVDRSTPAGILGGDRDFRSLISETARLGMVPIVDAVDRVSRNRMHRKYKSLTLQTLTRKGIPVAHPGTDGRQNQWEDTALLNYRNVKTFKMFVEEIQFLAADYGVRGIRLDNGQSFPPIMRPDMDELMRRDTDHEMHYGVDDIFYGSVVHRSDEYGYWSSDACTHKNYPNPFITKLCRDLWKKYPDFVIISESHFHRENSLLVSGAIPHSVRVPQILASASGHSLRRDGSVVSTSQRSTARTLSRLYRNDKVWLPKNPIMINCTCTHSSPYPGVLYGRRAWLAVDLLVTLPEIPMLLYGEDKGRAYRVNIKGVSGQDQDPFADHDVNFDAVLPKSPKNKPGTTSPADVGIAAMTLSGVAKRGSYTHLVGLGDHGRPPVSPTVAGGKGKAGMGKKPRTGGMPRGGSLADLLQAPPNAKMVKSMSREDMKGIVRSVSVEQLRQLSSEELQARHDMGPSSGYDLTQIGRHYSHRKLLRMEFDSLRRGAMCVLTVDPHLKEQVFAFSRYTDNEIIIIAANFKDVRDGSNFEHAADVYLDLRPLWDHLPDYYTQEEPGSSFYKAVDTLSESDQSDVLTLEELIFRKLHLQVSPLGIAMITLKKLDSNVASNHFQSCLHHLTASECNLKDPRENHLVAKIARGAATSISAFAEAVNSLRIGLINDGTNGDHLRHVLQLCIQRASQLPFLVAYEGVPAPRDFNPPVAEQIVAYLTHMSTAGKDEELLEVTRSLVSQTTKLGPLVFLTAELGRFSTAGGLGVMVDELTKGLANLGLEVYVISPYYTVNRKNATGYLGDNINWTRNIKVNLGTHEVEVGVFEGRENDVNLIFLERGDYFPKLYASSGSATRHLQTVILLSLGSLEVCHAKTLVPSLIVSNDWLPSMAAGYRKFFGNYFESTTFFHLIHNLGDGAYEGRCYPDPGEGNLEHVHRLPHHELVNPWWQNTVVNPSRCALLKCNSWGTVSPSYLKELLANHPLSDLLKMIKSPFAYPNGIRQADRERALREKGGESHEEAKETLQKRYFGFKDGDPTIPLFCFVGRITSQKGVHLILDTVDELVAHCQNKIQILVGGPANWDDDYSADCARRMMDLRRRHPHCFWCSPDDFFMDGPTSNLGADFGLMPSLFEPGGIVQQEFFVAGTPVVAYKTGGLKDTVHEWKSEEGEGNGFTFENYTPGDLIWAIKRALRVFTQPDEYAELRASAYETTIDVTQVAWAWSSEFHRLRNAMYTRGEIVSSLIMDTVDQTSELYDASARPVDIVWTGRGKAVLMKGSFDNWNSEWTLLPDIAGAPNGSSPDGARKFIIKLLLKPGEYMYKFRVDGEWMISDDLPQRSDGGGFVNNVLVVAD